MTAHYFTGKTNGNRVHLLYIVQGASIVGATPIQVASKAEARRIAKEHNAKPWNF